MKFRQVFELLGFRSKPRTYGTYIEEFELAAEGTVRFAQWKHPKTWRCVPTQDGVDALRGFLRPGGLAIDIGAHIGDTAVPMALAAGPTGTVLALEPNPYAFAVLKKNAGLNPGKTNIVPLEFAATAEDGEYEFEYSDAGFCNGGLHEGISRWRHAHPYTLKVRGRFLPAVLEADYPELLPKLQFIKIDAEGYDLAILKTLSDLIARYRPHLEIEVFRHTAAETRRELYDVLDGLGYTIFKVEVDTGVLKGPRVRAGDMTRWSHFDVYCEP